MLVLARSAGQSVVLDEKITVTVLATHGGIVRLGIAAPGDVGVRRGELDLHDESERRARAARTPSSREVRAPAEPAAGAAPGSGGVAGGVVDVTDVGSKSSPSA